MASNGVNDTVTVANGPGIEIPKKIVDLNTTEPDDILDGEVKESTLVSAAEKKDEPLDTKAVGSTAAAGDDVSPPADDDVEKKIRRAERFGVSVKLTEEEKRNSRAERFGTVAAAVKDSQGTKKGEELKRKARADRFGVPASSSSTSTTKADKTEEEAKKKARLARFGKDTTKVDSAEEDKRKARALRFSKPATESSSDLPGKEAVVSGNAA